MNGLRHVWIWYTPFGLGGVETFLERVTRALVDRGNSAVVVAVSSLEGPFPNRYARNVEVADWSGFSPAFMGQEPAGHFETRAAHDVARWRPNIFWLNDTVDFGLGAASFLGRLKPYCTIVDTLHVDSPDDGYLRRRRPYMKYLDAVVSSSRSALDRFRGEFPRAAGRIPLRYIPYGVPLPVKRREAPAETLRLLWAARLDQPQKRALDLVPVLARLRGAGREFRLTIAGDGPEKLRLEEGLRQEGLLPFVRFEGPLPPEHVRELYAENDVFVNLSAYEGFSISVIEALAAGCVPLCTEVPSLDRSILRDGVNCLLVPPGAPEIAGRIIAAAGGDRLRAMSLAAAESARGMTVEKCLYDYLSVAGEARSRRPIAPWPSDAEAQLRGAWRISRHNPWIPHPGPLRALLPGFLKRA